MHTHQIAIVLGLVAVLSLAAGVAVGRVTSRAHSEVNGGTRRNRRYAIIVAAVTAVALLGAVIDLFRQRNLLEGGALSGEGYLIVVVGFIVLADKFLGVGEATDRDEDTDRMRRLEKVARNAADQMEILSLDVRERVSEIPSFTDFHNIRNFPSRSSALEYCMGRLKAAAKVKNTVFRRGDPCAAETSDETYIRWLRAKTAALRRRDSPAEIHEIVCGYLPPGDPQRQFVEASASLVGYRWKSIDDSDFPLLNMTVIEKDGSREKEVIFGWDFADSVYGQCFATQNPPLVEYFEAYFRHVNACLTDPCPCWKTLSHSGTTSHADSSAHL